MYVYRIGDTIYIHGHTSGTTGKILHVCMYIYTVLVILCTYMNIHQAIPKWTYLPFFSWAGCLLIPCSKFVAFDVLLYWKCLLSTQIMQAIIIFLAHTHTHAVTFFDRVLHMCVGLFLAGEKASPGKRHRGHHICGREESRGRLRVESHLWPQLYEVSLQPHLCSRLVRPHQEWIQVGVHVPGAKSHFMLRARTVL